ncbi:type VII secretion protein EccB [Mycobacteroides salmoniphilum]|uniref:ESX-1 secretion system protein eccB1 n=1 Tax=Mycobacteroides salmoniphilum TaxID=404941 RepID=A0A4R8T176_9MYCO|nr:type VII secretion protein EccB [Mycobacteroides salmoniphilum]TEA09168.1 ESX-1 secretion system protein eccB1 [Mycobacteroides salmoniphilum]
MTAPQPDEDPVVSSQPKPSMRLATKLQFLGEKFIRRRVEHAIVRRNTEMWDDPMQFYDRADYTGYGLAAVVAIICVLLAFLKAQGAANGAQIVADINSNQLWVLEGSTARPMLNLTSARLFAGQNATPKRVKPTEISSLSTKQVTGIPGAPWDTPIAPPSDGSYWSICDTASDIRSVSPSVAVSVLADQPEYSPTAELTGGRSAVTTFRGQTFLVDSAGRHPIDMANAAVTAAINLPPAPRAIPLSEATYNALAPAASIALDPIAAAGDPNTVGLDPSISIGTVITDSATSSKQMYVVMPDGLAKVNAATAAALRNTNTYGHIDPPIVAADKISAIASREYTSPLQTVTVVDRSAEPVLCWNWSKTGAESTVPQITVTTTNQIPLSAAKRVTQVHQITTGVTVYPSGAGKNGTEPVGRFVRIINPIGAQEARFYMDRQGVRYGVPDVKDGEHMGLTSPQAAPWPVLARLATGPDLTAASAGLEHDSVLNDSNPRGAKSR